MSNETPLTLYYHPLSSYCMKALIALYETDAPFKPHMVDLGDPIASAEFKKIWPIGKFPVLRDDARDRTIPESSIIMEYLAQHYPGRTQLLAADPDVARQTRLRDRFFDFYLMDQMAKIVTDRLRPAGKNDSYGVEQARAMLETACGMIDRDMQSKTWAMGETFSMADCAAAPALFYADKVMLLGRSHAAVAAYLDRLMARPSFAKVLKEAEPYFAMMPQ